jgi:hypothetical protein
MSDELDSWRRQLESHKNFLNVLKNSKAGALKGIDENIRNQRDPANIKSKREEKKRVKDHWDSQIRGQKGIIESHKFYKPKSK